MADEPPCVTRDDLRRLALHVRRDHDPAQQTDNGYERCALCNYSRHPCTTFELADAVLTFLDQGRTGEWESDAD